MDDLKSYFARYWPGPESDYPWQKLVDRYRGRAYHNLDHLRQMLTEAANFRPPEHPAAFAMALCYHDAIYDPLRRDNELRSAELAYADLTAYWNDRQTQRVRDLILATRHHRAAPKTPYDIRLLIDLDLSVLARPELDYDEYTKAIRAEYRWIPDFIYRNGRRRVLEQFLEREPLFTTERGRERYEQAARINLRWELEELT